MIGNSDAVNTNITTMKIVQICKIRFTRWLENDAAEELLEVPTRGVPWVEGYMKEDSTVEIRVWLRLGLG